MLNILDISKPDVSPISGWHVQLTSNYNQFRKETHHEARSSKNCGHSCSSRREQQAQPNVSGANQHLNLFTKTTSRCYKGRVQSTINLQKQTEKMETKIYDNSKPLHRDKKSKYFKAIGGVRANSITLKRLPGKVIEKSLREVAMIFKPNSKKTKIQKQPALNPNKIGKSFDDIIMRQELKLDEIKNYSTKYLLSFNMLYRTGELKIADLIAILADETNVVIRPNYADKILNKLVEENYARKSGGGVINDPYIWKITPEGSDAYVDITYQKYQLSSYLLQSIESLIDMKEIRGDLLPQGKDNSLFNSDVQKETATSNLASRESVITTTKYK